MAKLEKEIEIEVEVEVNEATLEGTKKNGFKKLNIPWYITGFFFFTTLKTLGVFNGDLSNIFHFISSKFEIIALAGIGMRVKLSTLFSQGPKAITYGLAIGVIQVVSAITFIKIMYGLNF
jgi:uncharacterized membrane protein YadS